MSEEFKEEVVKPLTQEEIENNKKEEIRKSLRVIQIIQYPKSGKIEVAPIQNISYRSDIVGILVQTLNNLNNEDIMHDNVSLLRETITVLKPKEKYEPDIDK
jgi:hypothetical protein